MLEEIMSSIGKDKHKQNYNEDDDRNVMLRLDVQNLELINSSLKEKVIELSQKVKASEDIFKKFNLQYTALFEGKPIAGSVVVNKDLLDELNKIAEEYKSRQREEIHADAKLHLKLEEREKELTEAKERIKELKGVLERQSETYEALMKGNESVMASIHKQFEAYNEIASTESLQLRQLLEEKKATIDARTDELRLTIETLDAKNKELLQNIDQLKAKSSDLELQLENKILQIENLSKKYENLKADISNNELKENRKEQVMDRESINELQAELTKKTEENKTLQEQLKVQDEISNNQKLQLEAQNENFKKREVELMKQVNNLQESLKELISSDIYKQSASDITMAQSENRLKIEQQRNELLMLKTNYEKLLRENTETRQELVKRQLNFEHYKEDSKKYNEVLEQLEKVKKDNVELLEELEKVHDENIRLRNADAISSKELIKTKLSLGEAEFRLKILIEKVPTEEVKDTINPVLRKLLNLVKKAKDIITERNKFTEHLKKDNEILQGELRSKRTEGLLVRKRKKLE